MKCSISNIANVISESIPNPAESGFDIFVGLEHYDSGEVKVTRYGSTQNLVTAVKVFRKGDILLARRNVYLKRAGLVDFDGVTSGDSIVLRVKDDLSSLSLQSEDIRMYLPFVLNTEEFWNYAEKYSDGTMSKRLSPKTLLQYEFDIPDDVTQKNRLLWRAYKTKESYKAMILATDEMVKSQFIEMFDSRSDSFKKYPISDLCHSSNDIKCGPFGTQLKQAEYTDHGVPVWGIPQINSGFTTAPDVFVSEEKAQQLEQFSLVPGDIAMSRKGNVGMCALYPDSYEDGIIASDVVRIRVDKEKIIPHFLVYQLHNSHQIRKQILEVSDGTVMAGINVTKMKSIIVYCPDINSQQKFKAILVQTDKSKFELKQAIEKIDKVMRALMQ